MNTRDQFHIKLFKEFGFPIKNQDTSKTNEALKAVQRLLMMKNLICWWRIVLRPMGTSSENLENSNFTRVYKQPKQPLRINATPYRGCH